VRCRGSRLARRPRVPALRLREAHLEDGGQGDPHRPLHRYLAEFDFRYNNRLALGVSDEQRAAAIVKGIVGKRLIEQLVAPDPKREPSQRRRVPMWSVSWTCFTNFEETSQARAGLTGKSVRCGVESPSSLASV